jgi:hypothetical protein
VHNPLNVEGFMGNSWLFIIPDSQWDSNKLVRFKEGRIRVLEKRSVQAQRFNMVHSADIVISIEGGRGTGSIPDVALAKAALACNFP